MPIGIKGFKGKKFDKLTEGKWTSVFKYKKMQLRFSINPEGPSNEFGTHKVIDAITHLPHEVPVKREKSKWAYNGAGEIKELRLPKVGGSKSSRLFYRELPTPIQEEILNVYKQRLDTVEEKIKSIITKQNGIRFMSDSDTKALVRWQGERAKLEQRIYFCGMETNPDDRALRQKVHRSFARYFRDKRYEPFNGKYW